MKVLVTGGHGFIGQQLIRGLVGTNLQVISISKVPDSPSENITYINLKLEKQTDYSQLLKGVEVVIHLANIAHVALTEIEVKTLFETNVELTSQLAEAAAKSGVKRFIYLSSTKVFGEPGPLQITETTTTSPERCDCYGQSKLAAEEAIQSICEKTAMEYCIFRIPMVYGEGVKGNLARLIRLADSWLPLPKIEVPRSVLSVSLLVRELITSLRSDVYVNEIILLADPESMSVADWFAMFRTIENRPTRMFPVPVQLLGWLMKLTGYREEFNKLARPMVISSERIKQLDWNKELDRQQAVEEMLASDNH